MDDGQERRVERRKSEEFGKLLIVAHSIYILKFSQYFNHYAINRYVTQQKMDLTN